MEMKKFKKLKYAIKNWAETSTLLISAIVTLVIIGVPLGTGTLAAFVAYKINPEISGEMLRVVFDGSIVILFATAYLVALVKGAFKHTKITGISLGIMLGGLSSAVALMYRAARGMNIPVIAYVIMGVILFAGVVMMGYARIEEG